MDIMKNFSSVNVAKMLAAVASLAVYVAFVLSKFDDNVGSKRFIGLAGLALVALSIAGGLGVCALLRMPFNASTTQIVPYIVVGLGLYALFLMISSYSENVKLDHPYEVSDCVYHVDRLIKVDIPQDITAEYMKQVGPLVLLVCVISSSGFFCAYFIPLPALRVFVLQTAILILFSMSTLLFLFPVITALDLRRRRHRRIDLLCCFVANNNEDEPVENEDFCLNDLSRERVKNTNIQAMLDRHNKPCNVSKFETKVYEPFLPVKRNFEPRTLCTTDDEENNCRTDVGIFDKLTIEYFVGHFYCPLIETKAFKAVTILSFIVLLVACLAGVPKVRDGFMLSDLVPRGTTEHKFLDVQHKYFGFFYMFAITEGNFEYPTNQKLLLEYHHAFTRVGKIIKNDNGGLPDFWLTMFRDWLQNLQAIFDKEYATNCITQEGWFNNASDDGILAYKLLVQTGRVDNPIDKSLITKVKLVDANGIINPKAFYNYLTAWVSNDAIAYSFSQASFHPTPKEWTHVARDYELKIPKSQPLKFTQMPFYLNKMNSTEEITATIQEIRSICAKFEDRGLPNFPTGLPFVYWEQYIRLPIYLVSALAIAVVVASIVLYCFLFNVHATALIIALLVLIVIQLYGLMGHFNIPFNAVPTVILIFSIGMEASFMLPAVLVSIELAAISRMSQLI